VFQCVLQWISTLIPGFCLICTIQSKLYGTLNLAESCVLFCMQMSKDCFDVEERVAACCSVLQRVAACCGIA